MRVDTGKVLGGKIVVEGIPFPGEAAVTVLARDDDKSFEVLPIRRQRVY